MRLGSLILNRARLWLSALCVLPVACNSPRAAEAVVGRIRNHRQRSHDNVFAQWHSEFALFGDLSAAGGTPPYTWTLDRESKVLCRRRGSSPAA